MIDPLTAFSGIATSAPKGAEEASQGFEEMFVGFVLREVRKAMPDDGLFGGKEMQAYRDLLDQELAKEIARSGRLGFGDSLARHLGPAPEACPIPGGDLPVSGRLTSRFGERTDPFTQERKKHHGVDLAAPAGTPIEAARDGVVRFAGEDGGYGNVVIVSHDGGAETRYAHCLDLAVKAGERVSAGQAIARVGATGRATGPHLHFEVRQDGVAVDPLAWLGRADPESSQTADGEIRTEGQPGSPADPDFGAP